MKCHYCDKRITEQHSYQSLQNTKTGQIVYLHYPNCVVSFTTFRKTKKEIKALKRAGCSLAELLS